MFLFTEGRSQAKLFLLWDKWEKLREEVRTTITKGWWWCRQAECCQETAQQQRGGPEAARWGIDVKDLERGLRGLGVSTAQNTVPLWAQGLSPLQLRPLVKMSFYFLMKIIRCFLIKPSCFLLVWRCVETGFQGEIRKAFSPPPLPPPPSPPLIICSLGDNILPLLLSFGCHKLWWDKEELFIQFPAELLWSPVAWIYLSDCQEIHQDLGRK